MERDTIILAALCLFVILVGFRLRQRYVERPEQKRIEHSSRFRLIMTIIQLVVLGGLMIYMIPVLWRDINVPEQVGGMDLFLRCLIFVFTIYIFISGVRVLLRQRNKEKSKK